MNTTREVVAPAVRAAAEDICGPDADRIFTTDTRELMAFFVILRKLVGEVCIPASSGLEQLLIMHSAASTTSHFKTCTSPPIHASSEYSPT